MLHWTSNPRRIFPYFATRSLPFIKQGVPAFSYFPLVPAFVHRIYPTAVPFFIPPSNPFTSDMLSIQLSSNLKLCHRGRPLPARPPGFVSFTTAALINHEILRFLSSLSFHVVIDSIIHSPAHESLLAAGSRAHRNYGAWITPTLWM